MIVYHIDLIEKECLNDTTNVIHLTGWCYSRKQDIQFSCYDNIYLEKEYPVSVSRNQRNDVSQVLDINSDCELGFSLDITLPDNANAILVIANEDAKITLPMEDLYLYPQCSNMAASSVWKELRDAATLKAEQLMLADPNLHIIYNFDIINKENAGDKVIYHLVGWCLSDEHPVQFTCCSSFDLQTQYCVDAEWVFRDDVNQLLAIDIERKLGFSIDITLPAQENGLLILTCGAVKITFLLDELHSNCSNIATSELWKNMLAERRMKEEQEYLTNPHHHIIYNFDLAARESWNENTDIYNLAGWCYCGENPAQFACHDVNDPQKEYQVFISRNFRSDLNKALGIRPEHEPGFALVISMPTGAKGVLTITSGNYEIILPLEELHQPCSNIGISKLWKKLRSAAELMEQEQETPTAAPDKEKQQNSLLRHSSWGEHLLFVVHFADRTGAPLLALSIVEQLYKMGYNLHVIVLRDGELVEDLSKYARVYVAELENEEKFRSILVELQKYQIKNAFLNTTVSGYYAKLLKENNYTVVTLVHEMAHTLREMSLQTAAENTAKYSDKIVIPSTLIKDNWHEFGVDMPEDITHVLPQVDYHSDMNTVTEQERLELRREICEQLNLSSDAFLVIGCGTLEERKNPELFFETARKVAEKYPKVCFIWIGDYGSMIYKMKISTVASTMPNNARLLPYQKLNRYFYASDVFFLPSSADPFPTVALLAAKNSLPIVFCEKSTGIRDLFQNVANCAAKECTVEDFSALIEEFVDSETLRQKSGAECAEIYKKMYSFKEYTIRLFELGSSVMPRVSCIIPNYNYARFLPERVLNAVQQTYPVYELLILDDCSKDESDSVINELTERYKNSFPGGIRYIKNTENAGVFRQWLRGAAMAKSDLIWIAEADDCCSEFLISKLIHAFTREPDVKIAYAQSTMLAADGSVTESVNKSHTADISLVKWEHDYISTDKNELENGLAIRNTIPNASAAIMNRNALLQVPEQLLSFKVAGDWFAYLHMIAGGCVAFCAEPLNYYRRHEGSAVAKNLKKLVAEFFTIQKFILQRYDLSADTVKRMKNEYLRCCTLAHAEPESIAHFDDCIDKRKEDESFLFVFDDVSGNIGHMLNCAAEFFIENGCPQRIFFLCLGHFSLPSDFAGRFPVPVNIVYYNDLCLYGFERNFCTSNNFRGAAVFMNKYNIKNEYALLNLLPEKIVIATDSQADKNQFISELSEYLLQFK